MCRKKANASTTKVWIETTSVWRVGLLTNTTATSNIFMQVSLRMEISISPITSGAVTNNWCRHRWRTWVPCWKKAVRWLDSSMVQLECEKMRWGSHIKVSRITPNLWWIWIKNFKETTSPRANLNNYTTKAHKSSASLTTAANTLPSTAP